MLLDRLCLLKFRRPFSRDLFREASDAAIHNRRKLKVLGENSRRIISAAVFAGCRHHGREV